MTLHASSNRKCSRLKMSSEKTSRCNQHSSSSNRQYMTASCRFVREIAISPLVGFALTIFQWPMRFALSLRYFEATHSLRNCTPYPAEVLLATRNVVTNNPMLRASANHKDVASRNTKVIEVKSRMALRWTPLCKIRTRRWEKVASKARPRRMSEIKKNE